MGSFSIDILSDTRNIHSNNTTQHQQALTTIRAGNDSSNNNSNNISPNSTPLVQNKNPFAIHDLLGLPTHQQQQQQQDQQHQQQEHQQQHHHQHHTTPGVQQSIIYPSATLFGHNPLITRPQHDHLRGYFASPLGSCPASFGGQGSLAPHLLSALDHHTLQGQHHITSAGECSS